MDVRLPDGTIIANVPDGTTKAQLTAKLKANGVAVPAEWLADAKAPQPQAAQGLGDVIRDIPRQAGLVGRSVVNAAASLPALGADAIGGVLNAGADLYHDMRAPTVAELVTGKQKGFRFQQTMPTLNAAMTSAGVPQPQNANERVAVDAGTLLLGAGGMARGAGMLADGAKGITKNVLASLAARPVVQGAGAVGSGVAGGSVREAGGSEGEQFAASLAGGVAGGIGADKLARGARAAGNAITRMVTPRAVELAQADQQISLILQRNGVDWAQVPERIRQSMREEAAAAMVNGQPLNADAVRRMLVFRRTGTTPTVGQLTQNPGQITREKNLAKTGANSTNTNLQALPELENSNSRQLLNLLDDSGARGAPRAPEAAAAAIGDLSGVARSKRNEISSLYGAARDSEGRSVVLDGRAAAQNAIRRLDEDGVGKLPPEVDRWLNDLSTGAVDLTVDYQQKLVKNLYRKMQGAGDNGDLRHGLRLVREALDDADVPQGYQPQAPTNPGNLPAVRSNTPALPGAAQAPASNAGQEAIDAYRRARSANRAYMQTLEANPALAAVDEALAAVAANPQLRSVADAVGPGTFIDNFITSKTATPGQVQGIAQRVGPEGRQALRQYMARYLKDAATGGADDITTFASKSYRDAFKRLEDKLPAFFSREEVQQFRDIADAAKYMKAQPDGSAVNNSASAALMLGRGVDMLERIAQKAPVGRDAITGVLQGVQQRQVMAPRNALATFAPPRAGVRVNPLVSLGFPVTVQAGENDRRNAPP